MGQKANSTFLRLNLQETWNSNCLEKKKEESSSLFYIDIKLKNYFRQFFSKFGIFLISTKLTLSKYVCKVLFSFFISLKVIKIINKILKKENILKQKSKYKKKKKKIFFFFYFFFFFFNSAKKRIFYIREKKLNYYKKKWKSKKQMILNRFNMQLLEVLKVYFNNKIKITLLFQKMNKGSSLRLKNKEAHIFRRIIMQLRYYMKFKYFKELVNIIIIVLKKKESAQLLVDYLVFQMSLSQQHNKYIRFLKQSLLLFFKSKIASIKGLKFLLKGRINGVARASIRGIEIGDIPRNSLKKSVNLYKSTSYTNNGTLGVKLWVYEK